MNEKTKKIPLFDVFMAAVKTQPGLYRATLPITLLIVIVKDLYLYCGGMPKNLAAYYVVSVVMVLLLIYLFSCFVYVSDQVLGGRTISLGEGFYATAKRMLHIYGVCIFIVVYCVGFYYLGHYLSIKWAKASSQLHSKYFMIIILFTIFPTLYGVVVLLFSPVLVLLRNNNMFQAIKNSLLLSWFHWFYVFSIYIFIGVIYILISPTSLHAHFFMRYYVMAVFDFIVLAILLPIFANMLLTILSELERIEG